MPSDLSGLENFFLAPFWPDYFFINSYPILGVFWNLALLAVPFFLARLLFKYWQKNKFTKLWNKVAAIGIFFLWLLFIPNTAYIITDVRHLLNYCSEINFYRICPDNTWMIMFFFVYASAGWLALVFLVNQMKNFIVLAFGRIYGLVFPWLLIPCISLGVLLGLLERWNSWQFFSRPLAIFSDALAYFSDWVYFRNWLVFTIGLYILYFVGDKLVKK